MPVQTTHTDYVKMLPYWRMMDDALSCQTEVQNKGETYIPKLDGMTSTQFEAYVKRASFPLFTKHVRNTFVGMVMRKNALLNNVPEEFVNNIDGAGTHILVYITKLVKQRLTYGRCASFVDYDNRAKVLLYPPENIINWRTKIIDNVERLSLVVLRETITDSIDEFEEHSSFQYRVLSLEPNAKGKYTYRQRVFSNDGEVISDLRPTQRHKELTSIPIEIHGGVTPQFPPLLGIAEQNFSYYRLDADYKHGLHYVALPTPYVTGIDPEEKTRPTHLGPTKMMFLPDGSIAGMIEFSGSGLQSIANAKEEIHDNIITLSSRILAPPVRVNETATAANIRNAGETANLAEMIGELSKEFTRILNYAINWKEVVTDVSVKLNTDFIPVVLSGADVASYVASYLKGGMSYFTLFHTLKRGEIVEGNRQLKEELEDIRREVLERNADEVLIAQKLANIQSKLTIRKKEDELKQGKEGEQSNKGQNFIEN